MTRIILPLDYFLLGATCFPSSDNEGTSANPETLNSLSDSINPAINEP